MDKFEKKTFKVSRGFTYQYFHYKGGDSSKPTVFIAHGFPDTAHLYADVVPHVLPLGFNILMPDTLGSGGTDKPAETKHYASKFAATDLKEIIDHEKIDQIIAVGHDWGSFHVQRVQLWYPEIVRGLILLNQAYQPPETQSFELQRVLKEQTDHVGIPRYAYWELFLSEDAPKLIESRLDSFICVLHGDKPEWMKEMFCTRGAMRKFLENDERVPLKKYAQDPQFQKEFKDRIARDGINAPLNAYRAVAFDVHYEFEKELPRDRIVINKPVRFMGSTGDAVCQTRLIDDPEKDGLLPDLEKVEITAAHWDPYEAPDDVGKSVANYLKNTKW